jgi:hypothetical protein
VYTVSLKKANNNLETPDPIDLNEALEYFNSGKIRVISYDDNRKWLLVDYMYFNLKGNYTNTEELEKSNSNYHLGKIQALAENSLGYQDCKTFLLSEVKKAKKPAKIKTPIIVPDEILSLAKLLYTRIKENNPNNISPSKSIIKWAEAIVTLNKKVKNLDTIKSVIIESQEDTFWNGVILSGQALAKHWNKLVAKRSNPNGYHQKDVEEFRNVGKKA